MPDEIGLDCRTVAALVALERLLSGVDPLVLDEFGLFCSTVAALVALEQLLTGALVVLLGGVFPFALSRI